MQVLNLFYRASELVVSTTHYPKPINQVAENISVVTSEEIKAMNAHNVTEVLNRIPGIFLPGYDRNFVGVSHIEIQGSSSYNTLVLLDGVRWNYLADGHAEIFDIPVGIIDRIEVIKGPASSAWGSSLGGVVNIITKSFSSDNKRSIGAYASYGERHTSDLRAEWSDKLGDTNYFIFAGKMNSDGLRAQRSYESAHVYSKIQIPVKENITVGISAGYSEPELFFGNLFDYDLSSSADSKTAFGTASADVHLTDHLDLNLSSYVFKNKIQRRDLVLTGEIWDQNNPGDALQDYSSKSGKWGSNGKLVWRNTHHTILLGGDFEHGNLNDKSAFAPGYDYTDYIISPNVDSWALYFNDTITLQRWVFTPGLRYDKNSISGDFVSPSLGITYQVNNTLLLRSVASRGFTSPPLNLISGGGLFVVPNADLKAETVNSYQIGIEAGVADEVWIKTTFFRHDVKDVFIKIYDDSPTPPWHDFWANGGSATRQGCEFEMHVSPFQYFSFYPGISLVHHSPITEYGATNKISANITLAYDNPQWIHIRLMGHYLWWDEDADWEGQFDDSIWDINISKSISILKVPDTDVFITGHNILNGASYDDGFYKNPKRWFECGMRVTF